MAAIIPVSALATDGLCRLQLSRLDLARKVSVYVVAGRQRAVVCATLLNMLRANDWEVDMLTEALGRAPK